MQMTEKLLLSTTRYYIVASCMILQNENAVIATLEANHYKCFTEVRKPLLRRILSKSNRIVLVDFRRFS